MTTQHPIQWPEIRVAALHRLIAETLQQHPERLPIAVQNLDRWEQRVGGFGASTPYMLEWRRLVGEGVQACVDVLTDTSDQLQPLRSCEPFAGILSNEDRWALLKKFSREAILEGEVP